MKTINALNEGYRKLFKRDRLELITSMGTEKVELLEQVTITNVYWENPGLDDEFYYLVMEWDGDEIVYYSGYGGVDFSYLSSGGWIYFEPKEVKIIEKWWEELKLTELIDSIFDEKVEIAHQHAEKNHVDVKIVAVETRSDGLLYTLSNDEKIWQPVDRKG